MGIQSVGQNLAATSPNKAQSLSRSKKANTASANVSFTGGMADKAAKYGWYSLRSLSKGMSEITEITNALIAAIGTGIIAPFIILVSPGKGDKEDKDKKFFQAIRQPLSALLALSFQVPATKAINKGIDKLAYEKHTEFFRDDVIGDLVPDKKYIKSSITSEELAEWEAKFDKVVDGKSLKSELEDQIRKEYTEVGLDVSESKLARKVEKRKKGFLLDKIADSKYKQFIEAKIEELRDRKFDIQNFSLITDEDRKLAIHRNKEAYNALEQQAKLSFTDRLARLFGFSTKKTQALAEQQKDFAREKALEYLKEKQPEVFTNNETRYRRYIENCVEASKEGLKNKRFWISLAVNLFMVAASCYALNWAHPRLKELIDKHKNADQQSNDKKVEVNA